jgi:hypothetical protein
LPGTIRNIKRLKETVRFVGGMFNASAVLAGSNIEANIGLNVRPGIITMH